MLSVNVANELMNTKKVYYTFYMYIIIFHYLYKINLIHYKMQTKTDL